MNRHFDSWIQFPEDGERNWSKSFILFHPQGEFSSLGLSVFWKTHFLIIPPVNVSQCSLGSVSFPSLHCPLTACIYKGEIICINMLTHGCHYLAKGFFCLAQLHKNNIFHFCFSANIRAWIHIFCPQEDGKGCVYSIVLQLRIPLHTAWNVAPSLALTSRQSDLSLL